MVPSTAVGRALAAGPTWVKLVTMLLALDTSTPVTVLALAEDRSLVASLRVRVPGRLEEGLLPAITRFEPAADVHARAVELVRNTPSYTPPVVIDARMKPHYPKELFCDPDTAARVTRRWAEYFPQGGVAMGDSDRGHLA